MTNADLATNPRDASRILQRYAKQYSAGAFATPMLSELEAIAARGDLHVWPGVVAVSKTLTRDSKRRDFTGRPYLIPRFSPMITHIAVSDDAPAVPDLSNFDWVFTYLEDQRLTDALEAQGRQIHALRVSAASEMIACWGGPGDLYRYPDEEAASFRQIPLDVPNQLRADIIDEVNAITSWHDDFPYYSDGSWDAVSLRGYDPTDPRIGVKPSEMGKAWHKEHADDLHRLQVCDWTTLAARTPAIRRLIDSVPWWGELERVRLLRMAGRGGQEGHLDRHTDVGDPDAGTRDGNVARFHLPLVTHPDITMTVWGLDGQPIQRHLDEWRLWYLDARKPHRVDNLAGIDRIHLVVDVWVDPAVREAIRSGTEADQLTSV